MTEPLQKKDVAEDVSIQKEKSRLEFEELVYHSLSEDIFEYLDKGKLTEDEIVHTADAAVCNAVSHWVLGKITHVERVG